MRSPRGRRPVQMRRPTAPPTIASQRRLPARGRRNIRIPDPVRVALWVSTFRCDAADRQEIGQRLPFQRRMRCRLRSGIKERVVHRPDRAQCVGHPQRRPARCDKACANIPDSSAGRWFGALAPSRSGTAANFLARGRGNTNPGWIATSSFSAHGVLTETGPGRCTSLAGQEPGPSMNSPRCGRPSDSWVKALPGKHLGIGAQHLRRNGVQVDDPPRGHIRPHQASRDASVMTR